MQPTNRSLRYNNCHNCHCSEIHRMHSTTDCVAEILTEQCCTLSIQLILSDHYGERMGRASATTWNSYIIIRLDEQLPGFGLPCHLWIQFNRFRCGVVGCTKASHAWGIQDNPLCICGAVEDATYKLNGCSFCSELPRDLLKLNTADSEAIY